MSQKYEALMNEVEVLNAWMGTVGCLEAMAYIADHEEEYEGTLVWNQLRAFMCEGARMFA